MEVGEAGCVVDTSAAAGAGGLPLASSSATRFSSCSMRSSIQRSRSVNGAGASIFAAPASLAGRSPLPSSSEDAKTGTTLPQNTATNITDTSLFGSKTRILLSYLFLPSNSANLPGNNDVWPFLLACLTDFVTNCGVSCRFALFVAHPLKQDEGVEDACNE